MSELFEAARAFYNATIADTSVIVRTPSAEKQAAVTAAADRLRTALEAARATPADQEPEAYLWYEPGSGKPRMAHKTDTIEANAMRRATKLYTSATPADHISQARDAEYRALLGLQSSVEESVRNGLMDVSVEQSLAAVQATQSAPPEAAPQ